MIQQWVCRATNSRPSVLCRYICPTVAIFCTCRAAAFFCVATMTAQAFLTGHTRQQKETARKRGPSLQQKTVQLGQKANIRIVTVYENPTHGVWHIAKYCPAGKTFPDIGRLVRINTPSAAKMDAYNL